MKYSNAECGSKPVASCRLPVAGKRVTNNQQLATNNQQPSRRGVLLLVVLSLLVLFAMIAVSFVIIASQQEKAAKAVAKLNQTGKDPQELLDGAMYQLLRDVREPTAGTNPTSAIAYHSLLRDMYGNDGLTASLRTQPMNSSDPNFQLLINKFSGAENISGNEWGPTAGQFLDLVVNPSTASSALSQIDDDYKGQLLTMTSGPAAGRSMRIVRYRYEVILGSPNINLGRFTVITPPRRDGQTWQPLKVPDSRAPEIPNLAESSFLINGRPFNGTGAGYNEFALVNEPKLSMRDVTNTLELGLLPNAAAYLATDGPFPVDGGVDESYDAADYQNMFLAYLPVGARDLANTPNPELIPSFHRPALVNYWYHWMEHTMGWGSLSAEDKWYAILRPYGDDWQDDPTAPQSVLDRVIDVKRKISLRPLREDHPNFTGGNLATNALIRDEIFNNNNLAMVIETYLERIGPWDIDNDGDGVRDSVWVDLGYPVMRQRDGRLYKPLFAILCVDLDGRLNVNAHGNIFDAGDPDIAGEDNTGTALDPFDLTPDRTNVLVYAGGVPVKTFDLPKGQGYGPPEISLLPLLDTANYQNVVAGRHTGTEIWPGTSAIDPHALIKHFGVPKFYDGVNLSSYSSPPNLYGNYPVGLDVRGNPNFDVVDDRQPQRLNTPYELDLSRGGARSGGSFSKDTPYTVHELERVLRPYDVDALLLEDRLALMLPNSLASVPNLRHLLTTDSWDLPVPSVATTRELRADLALASSLRDTPRTILDILRARVIQVVGNAPPAMINQILYQTGGGIVSPDLAMGLRMDINRPFGNGRDDGGNGVVDEPNENIFATPDRLWESLSDNENDPFGKQVINFTPYDANNDGAIDNADYLQQRQLYARHLYVLMMALTDKGYVHPLETGPGSAQETARRIAQWAINVVDFRDADAIMTLFEYDENPFNGWDVDGWVGTTPGPDGQLGTADDLPSPDDPGPTRGVVWGCERPELLITETLAFHDQRLTVKPGGAEGFDYEQITPPISGFFVELYNPWSAAGLKPGELYNNNGLVLDNDIGGSPVWRLLVLQKPIANVDLDPDDPNLTVAERTQLRDSTKRSIYFTSPASLPADKQLQDDLATRYYTTKLVGEVGSGQYVVIGPNGPKKDGVTPIGGPDANTRTITLIPGASHPDNVRVRQNGSEETVRRPQEPVTAIVIDRTINNANRSLSVSDNPAQDYPEPTGADGQYTPPLTTAQDAGTDPEFAKVRDVSNQLAGSYRLVYLQRLANPLIAWKADTNPYRTIDSMAVHITAFNSLDAENKGLGGMTNNLSKFSSKQRGEAPLDPNTPVTSIPLWSHEEEDHRAIALDVVNLEDPAGVTMQHSLGFLNVPHDPTTRAPFPMNAEGLPTDAPAVNPEQPFPWLTWNNRPYISQYELMPVPASSSSRLFYDFTLEVKDAGGGDEDPYDATTNTFNIFRSPFGHLLNFFKTAKVPSDNLPSGANGSLASHFYRIFDYTYVPSRFVGTETVLNPGVFGDPAFSPQTAGFRPPFNKVSNYREPGRVNINTITHPRVWEGVLHGDPRLDLTAHPGPGFVDKVAAITSLVDTRRGYDQNATGGLIASGNVLELNNDSPTFFANPFRGSGAGELVPLPQLMRPDVETTLLRSDYIGDALPGAPHNPPSGESLFAFDPPDALQRRYNNSDRNPYFRYQGLTRLGNLVTTRSNVYAVWITVGFFEVQPAGTNLPPHVITNPDDPDYNFNLIYPDGYQLTQELGSDTGETRRHRGFYIIDRSLPVAFEPGENHNVDRAVLLRRFIE